MIYLAKDIKRSRNYFLNDATLMLYASDILMHPEFSDMGSRTTHKHESRQKHLLNVAYYAVKFARPFHLDLEVVVRAALLHDFYPYQRFKKHTKYREHIKRHPREALKHAEEHFKLSEKERNIILCHMWPLVKGRPKFKEAIPVILADNFAAITENFYHRAWQTPKRGVKKAAKKTKVVGGKVKKAGKKQVQNARINHQVRKVVRQVNKANKKEVKKVNKKR
jgi:uncharacterized protein